MYKYIVLCLCVSLSSILCDLGKKEGDACESNGVKGKCVKETQCFSSLTSSKHLVCSNSSETKIICCTDCKLINDTRNVVFKPSYGYYMKDGSKARDSCLEYMETLPYNCFKTERSFIKTKYDEEKKCHKILLIVWGTPVFSCQLALFDAEIPHQAFLGFGEDLESVQWMARGSIISDNYILTAGHVNANQSNPVKFIALGVDKITDGPTAWQVHTVKRFIPHPDYKPPSAYNDIALIETENTITFNEDVLPACLDVAVEAADDETAITTTWLDLNSTADSQSFADMVQKIKLEKFSKEECQTAYAPNSRLKDGINFDIQMCYGSKSGSPDRWKGLGGEPLMFSERFSTCIYSIIGVTSIGKSSKPQNNIPDVYTRLAPYKPWIESVVWP